MGKKIFYTERDIELLVEQGGTTLALNDDIVITELGREKAVQLGLNLIEDTTQASVRSPSSIPSAPSLVKNKVESPSLIHPLPPNTASTKYGPGDLAAKVKAVVMAQIGGQVSETLIDTVIIKVIAQLNLND